MDSKYNNYLSDLEKEQIIKLHQNGLNTVQIAKQLNRHNSSIGRYLKKQGFENTGTNSKFTKEDLIDIKKLYNNGLTSKEIFKLYTDKAKCEETIQVIIRKMGISRKRGYRNNFREDYFAVIDSSEKAYFLGLLLTDGNVHIPKKEDRQSLIQIGLKIEDKYILEKFKKELNSDNKISEYIKSKRNECYFRVYSNKMAGDLSKYGIIPNKTFLINEIPKISKEFIPDLIRGIFDGDGTVYILNKNDKLRFGFYGTYNLINDIVNHLNQTINTPKNKITNKGNVSFITFGRNKDILNFYNYIYYKNNIICLDRKKKKFEKYFYNDI